MIRESYDDLSKSLKTTIVSGTITASSQVTVTPQQAWPDPKAYIGLVTVTGNLSASLGGNITLNPSPSFIGIVTVANPGGSSGNITIDSGTITTITNPVGIKGNLTLSDPKGFIGLVTVVGSLSAAAGNITLDPGSKTGIVGNVTISDSKGFIGLVSVGGGVLNTVAAVTDITNPIAIKGNLTLSDSKTFVGLVSARAQVWGNTAGDGSGTWKALLTDGDGNLQVDVANGVGISGNITITDSKGYIGLVTVTQASSARTITGNLTLSDSKTYIGLTTTTLAGAWADPKTYIGLVTITGSLSAAAGNITLDPGSRTGIVGNLTLSDPKGFIGLVTIVGSLSAAAGNITLDPGSRTGIVGNITISDSKSFIGLVTLGGGTAWIDPNTYIGLVTATMAGSVNTGMTTIFPGPNYIGLVTVDIGSANSIAIKGNVTLSDPKGYIGLVSVAQPLSTTFSGNVTLDAGSKTQIAGNVTISDSKTYIGLVTVTLDNSRGVGFVGNLTLDPGSKTQIVGNVTISDSKGYIGLVTVTQASTTRSLVGNVTLSDAKTYIGLVTVTQASTSRSLLGNLTLSDAKTYIGLTTTTLGIGTTFIGLVTANTINTGTNKTLVIMSFGLGNNSLATVAVPTSAQRIKVTNLLLGSNITTEIAIKSGVTYLTGNATLGVTLFPGGGFELPGSPDSPSWIGLPSGALVVEKRDPGGTTSKIGGHAIYFDET
jgi:hypothetical protein